MSTIKKLSALSALLFTFNVFAAFNPDAPFYTAEPDTTALSLGAGNKLNYSVVYYICPDGDDELDGLSPENPKKTYSAALSLMNSLPADGAIAFCRGGTWLTQIATNIANQNATKEHPITFRDYQRPDGDRKPPEIIGSFTGTTTALLYFTDSSTAETEEGVIVENIVFTAGRSGYGNAISLYNDADFVTLRNLRIRNFSGGVVINANGGITNRFPQTQYDNLVFTHNQPSSLDTIQVSSGTFPAGIQRGDAITITVSNSNNKTFRIDSVSLDNTTLYISEGEWWDVVDESNTLGVMATVDKSDGHSTGLIVEKSLFENHKAAGFYGRLKGGGILRYNTFVGNGYGTEYRDHHIYFTHSDDSTIENNRLIDAAPYAGDGDCSTTALVGHGVVENIKILDNYVYQPTSTSGAGCYGIAVDAGYPTVSEVINNVLIDGNYVINAGYNAIGCSSCTNTTISNNVIECSKNNTLCRGIIVPNRARETDPPDALSSNITISDNKIIAYGAILHDSSGPVGIRATGSEDTSGFISILNNTVSGWNLCIDPPINVGATVTVSGNTTTNCGAGGGEQP